MRAVYAYTTDIDNWLKPQNTEAPAPALPLVEKSSRTLYIGFGVVTATLLVILVG
ncbi:MAG: hypothetical protein HYX27_14105 [Acidobacteria bacterium]|nr:hypothetical protein [Acidobacteriota bacterium]